MTVSIVSFSFSWAAQPEAQGPSSLLDYGFLYCILLPTGLQNSIGGPEGSFGRMWLSLPHLYSGVSEPQLSDFLFSPNYIIVQSPTQYLEWPVWSSSSGNNCPAVHRSLFRCISLWVYHRNFTLSHIVSQVHTTRFLLISAIGMCHFHPVHHFGMAYLAGLKVNI